MALDEAALEISLVMGSPRLLRAKAAEAAMSALCSKGAARLLRGRAENDAGLWHRPSAAVANARGEASLTARERSLLVSWVHGQVGTNANVGAVGLHGAAMV